MFEALYHAVPLVTFPLSDDHFHNAKKLEDEGASVSLNYQAVSKDTLLEAVTTVLTDPR